VSGGSAGVVGLRVRAVFVDRVFFAAVFFVAPRFVDDDARPVGAAAARFAADAAPFVDPAARCVDADARFARDALRFVSDALRFGDGFAAVPVGAAATRWFVIRGPVSVVPPIERIHPRRHPVSRSERRF